MRHPVAALLCSVLFVMLADSVHAQNETASRRIAVFAFDAGSRRIPAGALSLVDDQIAGVFEKLGGYEVVRMEQRIDPDAVPTLLEKLNESDSDGGPDVDESEAVQVADQAFTESDVGALRGAFLFVIPFVSAYETARDEDGLLRVELETKFGFVDTSDGRVTQALTVRTSGAAAAAAQAARVAVDAIAPELAAEIRSIGLLRPDEGIVDVDGRGVLLAFGREQGVRPGDEYVLRPADSGSAEGGTGLLVVKDVGPAVSGAVVVYAHPPPAVGDRLERVQRIGLETSAHILMQGAMKPIEIPPRDEGEARIAAIGVAGIRQTLTRGLYAVRPHIGIDIAVPLDRVIELPSQLLMVSAGASVNWHLWRLRFAPSVSIGIAVGVPGTDDSAANVSHIGGNTGVRVSYALNRDFELDLDVGYITWLGQVSGLRTTFVGFYAGIGTTYKY